MIFSTLFASLTLAASALAAPNLAARAAPSVTYPRAGTIWAPNYRHNVTWAAQSGTGTITMGRSGLSPVTLASNVNLENGRTEITVPGNVPSGSGYTVSIATGGETSSSQQFSVGPVDTPPPSGSGTASSVVSSATSIASSAASSASSAVSSASSAASSASSVLSSSSSSAESASSSAASASSSIAESASSAASSVSASLSSVHSSASSAASSVHSSASSAASSAASSIASAASSAASSATSSHNAGMHAVELGVTRFGIAVGAGLVAVATFSGALIF